jgi:hypothetical protein
MPLGSAAVGVRCRSNIQFVRVLVVNACESEMKRKCRGQVLSAAKGGLNSATSYD